MNQRNRISPPSRWPLDPRLRIQRANTDLAFVDALRAIGCVDVDGSMDLIEFEAYRQLDAATAEIARRTR